ncbi:DUF4132 domain-containing protein [Micromonospora narathiwatensis]|uniref:Uncharacterized protein n=1 Tax=Micromonospora narathiwatensis TaxID=299146 RepID=A0A1A8ZSP7_9ACTN|nr:DUF4132 domain-containing protein [Micromonospora narathiwatensis]SBT46894.1 protein of unknown function (DUF4132) [Micromonospora narathiwatensis]
MGTLLAAHRDRAGVLIRGVRMDNPAAPTPIDHDILRTLSDERALSLCVVLVESAAAHRGWEWTGGRLLADLGRRSLPWTPADVDLLFTLARGATHQTVITVLKAAAGAAESLDPADRAGLVAHFREALRQVEADSYDPSQRGRVALRLRALIESAVPAAPGRVRVGVIHVEDGWSQVAVERLLAVTVDTDAVSDLLDHAGRIPPGPRPSRSWLKRAGDLLAGRRGVVALVRELLELAHTCEPAELDYWGVTYRARVGPSSADLVRGLLWSAQVTGEQWLPSLVLALAESRPEPRVLNTCYAVLGRSGTQAVGVLMRLQRATRDRGDLAQIAKALDEAADRAGISRSELTEQTISDAGLDERRERRMAGGAVTGILALDDLAKVSAAWEYGGTRTARPPEHADPELVKALKHDAAELRKLVTAERDRLEDLLVEEREWPLETWRQRYADHPVTGSLALRLLWTVIDLDRAVTALPAADGRFTLVTGETIVPGPQARVRVWHPVAADPEEVRLWRAYILAHEVAQPFKQAFREVYLLTPAEEETGVYSNRFAAHVLRYQQTYALMKERRWATNYLGGWDGGYDGEAKRDFPAQGLRAAFYHQQAGDEGGGHEVMFCTTDQVRFQRSCGRQWETVSLAEVPPVVFSEAMRDVDLFIGVASIATDPTWADRGTDRRFAYWQGVAFGDLTPGGQVRRQVIEHLLPKLKIRDRARLAGHYLVVEGRKRTYRIHVGSGNILMSPNDQYLCIVPARGTKKVTGVRFVPFEGDEMLAVVLSKAFLLADDHRITDPSILRQIG